MAPIPIALPGLVSSLAAVSLSRVPCPSLSLYQPPVVVSPLAGAWQHLLGTLLKVQQTNWPDSQKVSFPIGDLA